MNDDLIYQIGLTQIPGIGAVHARTLINAFGNAKAVFTAPKRQLEAIEGLGSIRSKSIKSFTDFRLCEKEIRFIEKFRITPLFITESNYPARLLNCYDSPVLLYYRGITNLNSSRIVSVVGTRSYSDHGKYVCDKLVEELAAHKVIIVSGLAFGIDTIAHRSALKYGLDTIGVLAHGLDRIYPPQNKSVAKDMMAQGGLLSEFTSGSDPDRENFPKRNRIVAGMCDCLVVVESGPKGGSLITGELANSYNKDVFAFPGRATDHKSEGCNYLIKSNKAALVTSAADVLNAMGWNETKPEKRQQRSLFVELTTDEKLLTGILLQKDSVSIDELYTSTGLSSSAVAGALLTLEMQGLVSCLPGKMYKLL